MDDTLNIYSIEELFKRIKPALYSKCKELKRIGIDYVKEVDIWNYLSERDWKKRENLSLSQMVSDILTLDNQTIKEYVLNILKKDNRTIIKKEEDLL